VHRWQQWGPKQEHVLVHIHRHVVGQPEEGLHHPLIEEGDCEPGIIGLHSEPAIELLELEPNLPSSEGTGDVVDHVPGGHSQARTREPERHDRTREPAAGAERALVAGIVVPQVERPNIFASTPIPDDVLGPLPRMPEHRERQPRGVRGQIERSELQAGTAAQEHEAPLSIDPPASTPPHTGEHGRHDHRDEPPHQPNVGFFWAELERPRAVPAGTAYSVGMTTLRAGDAAPPFELLDQHGKTVRLEDFRGRKVLVYFYPEADTPGCTTQSCSIRDHRQDLAGIGMDVVGISPDLPDKQLAFDEKYGLGFPLLSDPDHAVADLWGTWGEKTRDGRTYVGIIRSSFLLDEDGRIERAWYGVKPEDTVPNALEALRT